MKITPTLVPLPLAVAVVAAVSAPFAGCGTGGKSASSSTPGPTVAPTASPQAASASETQSPAEVVDTPLPLTQEGAVPAIPDPVEVYVMSADGQPRLLTTLSSVPRLIWSSDHDRAALITDPETGSAKIHIISVKAGIDMVVADVAGHPYWVVWSPNGEWLAWETYDLHTYVIEVMRADGTERRELANPPEFAEYDGLFDWKDDHTLLATLRRETKSELFEFDVVSGSKRQVATQPAGATAVDLSRDASHVVFVVHGEPGDNGCSSGWASTLWIMGVSNGDLRQVLPAACNLNSASWSPDGSQIAYAVGDENAGGTYILDVASGATRRIDSPSTLFDHVLNWSSDGSAVIAYRSKCGGQGSSCHEPLPALVLIPVAGGSESIISGEGNWGDYAFSSDGGGVAFENDGLQVVQVPDGAVRQAMAADADWQFDLLGWSPDGQWFSFARSHSRGIRRQFEVNADGSGLKRLQNLEGPTPTPSAKDLQVPSPDGRRVAVVAWPMHIRDADGANEVSFDGIFGSQLAWSPDSKRLVFSSDCPLYSVKDVAPLLLVNADGSGLAPLTNGSPPDCGPAFSPDGKKVAFVRMEGDTQQVMTIDVNTREEKALLTVDVEYELSGVGPVWSPNGSLLALCVEGVGIYVIRADGSGGQQVVATDWVATDWSWGRGRFPFMRWQSDSVLYFVSGSSLY